MYIVVVSVWIRIAPTSEPERKNRPPAMEVPPITVARMASSSRLRPALLESAHLILEAASSPAMPAQNPQIT